MVKKILLNKNYYVEIDDEDYNWLSEFTWYVVKDNKTFYACRTENTGWGDTNKAKTIRMHREILKAKKGQITDHINRNGLDNRRSNLRIVTPRENMQNRRDTKHLGVDKLPSGRFRAAITIDGKRKHLGVFDTIEEASLKYKEVAQTL
jgi:hypothetical protein